MPDGIPCPVCGECEHSVLETRRQNGSIKRRRRCGGCGLPFKTHERADRDFKPEGR